MQILTISMLLFGAVLLGVIWSQYHSVISHHVGFWRARTDKQQLENASANERGEDKSPSDVQQSLIVVYLMAPLPGYAGYDLLQTCTCMGFQFDANRGIFTYTGADDGAPWVQLASAKKTGVFQLETLGVARFPGVALFMQLSQLGKDAVRACEQFISIIDQLQQELGGHCHNVQRQAITPADHVVWRQQADYICRQYGTGDLFAQMEG